VNETVPRPHVEAVVPVPADRDRLLWRGHHPAEALADGLAAAWGVPLHRALARTGAAPRQRGLHQAERRRNVRRAFRAAPAHGRLALVDDVYTTGATVSAAASALRRAGAREVSVVTFARTIRRG
jgi:ComF family protein